MYDIDRRQQFTTVGDLKKLLSEVDDDTRITICGDDYAWYHIEQDGSVVNLDVEDLEEGYPTAVFRNDG